MNLALVGRASQRTCVVRPEHYERLLGGSQWGWCRSTGSEEFSLFCSSFFFPVLRFSLFFWGVFLRFPLILLEDKGKRVQLLQQWGNVTRTLSHRPAKHPESCPPSRPRIYGNYV